MKCACCGRGFGHPGATVIIGPRTKAVLCIGCGERWEGSPDRRLHAQLVAMQQPVLAASQFHNFTAVQRRAA